MISLLKISHVSGSRPHLINSLRLACRASFKHRSYSQEDSDVTLRLLIEHQISISVMLTGFQNLALSLFFFLSKFLTQFLFISCFILSGHAHSQVPEMLWIHLAFLGIVGPIPTMPSPSALHLFRIAGQTPRSLVMYFRRVQGQEKTTWRQGFLNLCAVWRLEFWDGKEEDMDPRSALQKDNKREHMCYF